MKGEGIDEHFVDFLRIRLKMTQQPFAVNYTRSYDSYKCEIVQPSSEPFPSILEIQKMDSSKHWEYLLKALNICESQILSIQGVIAPFKLVRLLATQTNS